ncbi:hypothetical protein PAXRUDRAFT_22985 [Paxillus rubicundulus Ve08.2h10]|uniref:Homeobox domain-containing protein n=1 Tax=Paxillus rubicundulus Ve08.2h10 TaxID=930991 RepID=A0A0D0DYU8_9AGAM|nr:hypothetical protein PAXRUDRAFT_22985 [Paxillus rubicundulus Ve08.2h10]
MDIIPLTSPPLSPQKSTQPKSALPPPAYTTAPESDQDNLPSKTPYDEAKQPKRPAKSQDSDNAGKASSKKPRHRHSTAQLAALNALFDRNGQPSLEERNELAENLGMESKTVHAWFQNKRASTKKRINKGTPVEQPSLTTNGIQQLEKLTKPPPPSTLPTIANLLNSTPPLPATQLPQPSRSRSHTASSRKAKQKDLHLNDHLLADPSISQSQNNTNEGILESSFFAGPPEFFSVANRLISYNRGPESEDGAAPLLRNSDSFLRETDGRFVSENDGTNDGIPSRKRRSDASRMRTSPEQAEELRRVYAINAHPTREQRQELADSIGMRWKSVTNWFQNQRSQAKKHREGSPSAPDISPRLALQRLPLHGDELPPLQIPPPPPPPRSYHPSLMIPERDFGPLPTLNPPPAGAEDHHRETVSPRNRMSLPPSLHSRMSSPRIRRSMTPYAREFRDLHPDEGQHYDSSEVTRPEDGLLHPRRSRPEPHQLDALRKLLYQTSTPSIEQRSVLALEVGMDIGKVTNWFRNIRQTARKRAKRAGASSHTQNSLAYSYEHDASSGSSIYDDDDIMDLDHEDTMEQEMDERSEDDYQEAVTPSSDISSSPPPAERPRSYLPLHHGMGTMGIGLIEPSAFQELGKAVGISGVSGPSDYALGSGMNAVTYSGVKIEDALLLLSFHKHVVH